MKNSEKILVAGAIAACLFGAYTLVAGRGGSPGAGSSKIGKAGVGATEAKLAALRSEMTATVLPAESRAVFAAAREEWGPDPFFNRKLPSEIAAERKQEQEAEEAARKAAQGAEPVLEPKFSYTGYLDMGDKRLAVIDGMEYQIGQSLPPGDYILRRIEADKVILTPKDDNREIIVEREKQ